MPKVSECALPSNHFRVSRPVLLMRLFLIHFQVAKEEWSQTLWINLNVQFLQEGIESFLRSLRKLPRQVRNLSVAYHLESKMKAFKDSIPLLLDLKHEALRDRLVEELLLQDMSLLRSDDKEQDSSGNAGLEIYKQYLSI